MWWRKKKEKRKNDIEYALEHDLEAIKEFQAFRAIGETFNYLGVTLIVCRHYHWMYITPFLYAPTPCLCCDYVDYYGEIKQAEFGINELPGLISQNDECRESKRST